MDYHSSSIDNRRAEVLELQRLGNLGVLGEVPLDDALAAYEKAVHLLLEEDVDCDSTKDEPEEYGANLVRKLEDLCESIGIILDKTRAWRILRKFDTLVSELDRTKDILEQAQGVAGQIENLDASAEENMKQRITNAKIHLKLMEARRLLGISFVESYKRNSYVDNQYIHTCEERSVEIIREIQSEMSKDCPHRPQALQLLSKGLSYMTILEQDVDQKVKYAQESCSLLDVNDYALRLSSEFEVWHRFEYSAISRLAYYALEKKDFRQAVNNIDSSVAVMQQLVDEYPRAGLFWFELYRGRCTKEHQWKKDEITPSKNVKVAQERWYAAGALSRLLMCVPDVPDIWDDQATVLLDLADHYSDNGLNNLDIISLRQTAVSSTLSRSEQLVAILRDAVRSARKAVQLEEKDGSGESFSNLDWYYFREAKTTAKLAHALGAQEEKEDLSSEQIEEVLGLYRKVAHMIKLKIKNPTEETREDLSRLMEDAYTFAMKVDNKDAAAVFLRSSVYIISGSTERKRRTLYTYSLNTLADFQLDMLENIHEALSTYKESIQVSLPLYKEAPWHFFLGSSYYASKIGMARCYEKLGQLEEERECRLEWTVYIQELHNMDLDVETLQDGTLRSDHDISKLRELGENPPSLKKFVVLCNFEGELSPYSVYIGQNGKRDVDPLADQARVLWEDSGGTIPKDVRDAVCKLKNLALDNNVSFAELAAYALDAGASEQPISESVLYHLKATTTVLAENDFIRPGKGQQQTIDKNNTTANNCRGNHVTKDVGIGEMDQQQKQEVGSDNNHEDIMIDTELVCNEKSKELSNKEKMPKDFPIDDDKNDNKKKNNTNKYVLSLGQNDLYNANKKDDTGTATNRRLKYAAMCAICFNSLEPGEQVSWSPNPLCQHVYHTQCILSYAKTVHDECNDVCDVKCALCREIFIPK